MLFFHGALSRSFLFALRPPSFLVVGPGRFLGPLCWEPRLVQRLAVDLTRLARQRRQCF